MDFANQIETMLLALVTVIAVVLLLAYAVRALRTRIQPQAGDLEVISATHIGPKERILLVKVRDREVLLGIGPQSICSLAEFEVQTPSVDGVDAS